LGAVTAWTNQWPTLSAPVENPTLRVLSLGAGVQSTTLALAAARGDIGPMPDCAIFADTGWEPKAVMQHLEWLRSRLPFPVHIVSAGNIRESILARRNTTGGRYVAVPWFTLETIPAGTQQPIRGDDGEIEGYYTTTKPTQKRAMGRRQCTKEYKIEPITHKIRELLGVEKGKRVPKGVTVEQWIGISTDEIERMKSARVKYITHRFPLIEANMNRRQCVDWMAARQFSAPKSACLGCPFHSNAEWRNIRDNDPEGWADVIAVDKAMREDNARGMRGLEFMHRSCVPIDQAPLGDDDDRQHVFGFKNECEGMCGV
jgi:hypothetical protein